MPRTDETRHSLRPRERKAARAARPRSGQSPAKVTSTRDRLARTSHGWQALRSEGFVTRPARRGDRRPATAGVRPPVFQLHRDAVAPHPHHHPGNHQHHHGDLENRSSSPCVDQSRDEREQAQHQQADRVQQLPRRLREARLLRHGLPSCPITGAGGVKTRSNSDRLPLRNGQGCRRTTTHIPRDPIWRRHDAFLTDRARILRPS